MPKYHDDFDYEDARLDIIENGCDPDYLDERDPAKRDEYMRKVGLNPREYGSKYGENKSKDWDWGPLRNSSNSRSSDYDDDYDPDNSDDASCFVTTACTSSRGLPDDCEELTVLRAFRDAWVRKRPGGEEDISRYYAEAPGVVSRVNAREDAAAVWDKVYEEMVRPCVELIRNGKEEDAYALYRDWTLRLADLYG